MQKREIVQLTPDDKEFYHQFYNKYGRLIFYFANRYTTTLADCEDLVQDVVLRLMHNIPSLRAIIESPGRTAYYICSTVQSTFIDNYRKNHNATQISYPDDVLDTLIEERLSAQRIPFSSSYWDVQLLKQELPKRDWDILEGKYIIGYTDAELAERIGCTKDSVRMILTRAKKKARIILFKSNTDRGESDEQ